MERDETDLSNQNINEDGPSLPLTREALYALVWKEPMIKVAAKYKISSSYMARVCTSLNVPRPERGYWAKLAVGITSPIPPLPEAQPGDELIWSRDGEHIRVLPQPPVTVRKKKYKPIINPSDRHPLVKGAKELFEAGRLSYDSKYLKPWKRLLIDLIVTKTGLDKTLDFANNLFMNLEGYGHSVVFSPKGEIFHRAHVDEHEVIKVKDDQRYYYNHLWYPCRCTVVYIGTVAIGLTVIEMSEEVEVRYVNGEYIREQDYIPPKRSRYSSDHTWTTTRDFPTGRLRLQAYSPYPRAKWVKCWQETKSRNLDSQIKAIIKELENSVDDIARLIQEGERQAEIERQKWEIQREKWRQEEEARKRAQNIKDSREDLLQIITRWGEANRIENFFRDIEGKILNLNNDEQPTMLERLKQARKLIGSIDAYEYFRAWKSPEDR